MDQSVTMIALKGGLLKNGLQYSLEKIYPHNFTEMLARAEKYALVDEALENESPMGMGAEEKKEEEIKESPPKKDHRKNRQ